MCRSVVDGDLGVYRHGERGEHLTTGGPGRVQSVGSPAQARPASTTPLGLVRLTVDVDLAVPGQPATAAHKPAALAGKTGPQPPGRSSLGGLVSDAVGLPGCVVHRDGAGLILFQFAVSAVSFLAEAAGRGAVKLDRVDSQDFRAGALDRHIVVAAFAGTVQHRRCPADAKLAIAITGLGRLVRADFALEIDVGRPPRPM